MRRLLTGLSLAAIVVLGGVIGGCQPTKPCRCVQSEGCRCPLPPPTKKAAKSQGQIEPAQAPASESQAGPSGSQTHGERAASEQAAPGEGRDAHRHARRPRGETSLTSRHPQTPANTRANGVESGVEMERHEGQTLSREHPAQTQSGSPLSRSGGALSSDYNLRNDPDRDSTIPRSAPRSINARDALDPWHGYDADCPERARE